MQKLLEINHSIHLTNRKASMRTKKALRVLCGLLTSVILAWAGQSNAAVFKIDTNHSSLKFTVQHMMFSTISGQFTEFSGDFNFDPKSGELIAKDFVASANSVESGVKKRDDVIRSAEFFDVVNCKDLVMKNTKIKKTSAKTYEWTGDLNMHCISKPVKFDVVYAGSVKESNGKTRVIFVAKTKVNRLDWNLKWNKALDGGGVVLGNEVALELSIQAVEEKH